MLNPYNITKRESHVGFDMVLDSHNIYHSTFNLTIKPKIPEFVTEFTYNNKALEEIAAIRARLTNQYSFNNQTVFSAGFDKQDGDNQVLDETDLFNKLEFNHNLTESDIDYIDIECSLEQQIENQELRDSGWRFDKYISMKVYFYKAIEMNGSSCVKIPLRSSAILNIEFNDEYCFLWSKLAGLQPRNTSHPIRVSSCRKNFREQNIQCFDVSNGFRCTDIHKFKKLKNLSRNINEVSFYLGQGNWKKRIIIFEINKNDSDRVVCLLIYTSDYVLSKKVHTFSGLNKTTCFFEQIPVSIGFWIVSELINVSKSGFFDSILGYNFVD